jgi:stage III sporulation protein AH
LEELSTKEGILEEQIIGATEYQDVLVRSDGDKVHVHVKADQLSNTEVANIMQMVRDEFGEVTAEVNYQPTGEGQ